MKLRNVRFNISFDEWTSFKNKKFMNVMIYYENEYDNLGLVKIEGKCSVERIVEIIEKRLFEFDLNVSTDIVCATTDGAGVIEKYAQLSGINSQLCYNQSFSCC